MAFKDSINSKIESGLGSESIICRCSPNECMKHLEILHELKETDVEIKNNLLI